MGVFEVIVIHVRLAFNRFPESVLLQDNLKNLLKLISNPDKTNFPFLALLYLYYFVITNYSCSKATLSILPLHEVPLKWSVSNLLRISLGQY